MKIASVKTGLLTAGLALALMTGCATNAQLEKAQSKADAAQQAASQAMDAAQHAQQAADAAQRSADQANEAITRMSQDCGCAKK